MKIIKKTILETALEERISIGKIILFGSRARGNYKEDSDYDILIITNEKLTREKMLSFYTKCIRKLFKKGIKRIDLVILDKATFERERKVVNTIANEAILEGREI